MAIRGGAPHDNWNSGSYLDDQLWQQAMAADRRQAEHRAAQDKFALGARGGVPGWDIASTLQGNG